MKDWYLLTCFILCLTSCLDIDSNDDVSIENYKAKYAVPIINSNLKMLDIGEELDENTYIEIKDDGNLVVHYEGGVDVVKAQNIFPPFPIQNPPLSGNAVYWEIPDTNYLFPLTEITGLFSENNDFYITKSLYKNNHIKFEFTSSFDENIEVSISIPDMTKDGEVWTQKMTVPSNQNGQPYQSASFPLEGWILESENTIQMVYDARKPNGDRVRFDHASFNMDKYEVHYVEGYFGKNTLDIQPSEIKIGIFKKWKSGGFIFEDPSISLNVSNSFGFPVRTKVKYLDFHTLNGSTLHLENETLTNGLDMNFPSLDERDLVAKTYFQLNKTNSNIKELFNDKVLKVKYDIDALANPEQDQSVIGFIDEDSFFKIDVAVVLPLQTTINDLVLVDSFNFDLKTELDNIKDAEFKLKMQNIMPFDFLIQNYFVDGNGAVIDSFFNNEGLFMEAALSDSNNEIIPGEESTTFVRFTDEKLNNIKAAEKIVVQIKINSNSNDSQTKWITKDHGILMKLGVITEIEQL